MNTVSQPKVFEFAKEIGMETLALMDKIREWKLPVRSHMAELDNEMLEQIKGRLKDEGSKSSEAAPKKKVAKKATPKAAKAAAEPSNAIQKPANKKTATKKAAAAPAEAPPAKKAAASSVVVKKAPAKVVVRRKSDEEEAQAAAAAHAALGSDHDDAEAADDVAHHAEEELSAETVETVAPAKAAKSAKAEVPAEEVKAEAKTEAPQAEAKVAAPAVEPEAPSETAQAIAESTSNIAAAPTKTGATKVGSVELEKRAEAPAAPAAKTVVKPASTPTPPGIGGGPTAAPSASAPSSATHVATAGPVGGVTGGQHSGPTPVSGAGPSAGPSGGPGSGPSPISSRPGSGPVIGGPRKREVVMTSQGPVSGVKSEAPRRNIVGRMDLSRVQGPPSAGGSRPIIGGDGSSRPGPSSGPSRPGAIGGPRPLRTGFVASAPVEMPTDDASTRRNFDDKRARTRPGTGGGPGAGPGANTREKGEEEVKEFSSTEFRKREMVFQPKKKKSALNRQGMKTEITTPKASKRVVKVDQKMKLSDLANEIGLKAGQLTKALMKAGVMATMNTDLDFDTIALILPDFGFEAVNVHQTVDEMLDSGAFGELDAEQIERPPVVTIMGHVDHGKTSLLDAIRKARVASGEAGGITQHIGAYQVTTESGKLITFIDTPGHEAFTAMRARGANATDIAIIVVAADDGVMPQTIEAVSHAKAAGVPIIVALNKMDKAGANPDRVMQQLTEQQLVPEQWGGDTIYVPVSAHTKLGLPDLLEQIYLVAEVEELRANPKRSATGIVIESRMDKGRGAVATLLVQDGTLEVGQSIVVGSVPGRVRSLINDRGERIKTAGPSVPVEVQGLSEVPLAGDRFDVTVDEKTAEEIAATRKQRALDATVNKKISMEDIFSKLKQGDMKELVMVLKTDVAGSAEAIKGMLDKVGTSEVKVKLIHSAVGGISESDVLLASTAKGIVVGFNVRPDGGAQAAAKRLGVEIKTYTIVYEMMDDLKKALAGLLTPDVVEKELGRAEVRNVFTVPKIGTIGGCFVVDGKINRNAEVRLIRDGKIVYTGKVGSLKRFKDDAKEVATGFECGIGIENFNDLKVGDVIEAFNRETVVREL